MKITTTIQVLTTIIASIFFLLFMFAFADTKEVHHGIYAIIFLIIANINLLGFRN